MSYAFYRWISQRRKKKKEHLEHPVLQAQSSQITVWQKVIFHKEYEMVAGWCKMVEAHPNSLS